MEFIPVKDIAAFTETITLEGVLYEFQFMYNTREESWAMSIAKDSVTLLSNIKVVDSFELIGRFAIVDLPPGLIITVDLSGVGRVPNRDELGSDVKLAYITEAEKESGIIQ